MKTVSIRSLIDEQAATRSDAAFIHDPASGRFISFSQLQQMARAVAADVHRSGVRAGESVAYAMQNSARCAVSLLGIMYGGYRATAVNLVSGSSTLKYVLEHSDTKLVLADMQSLELLQSLPGWSLKSLPTITVNEELLDQWLKTDTQEPSDILPSDSDALLMYTSGTTGRPKGVLLSHDNLVSGGNNTQLAHQLTRHDKALCVLPLYHINGLCVSLMGSLVSGGQIVLPTKFSASTFWMWVVEFGCTWFSVVPTQISYLLHADNEADLSKHNVRFGRSASAPLSPEVQQKFESRFGIPIVETMGLTETAAQILSNPLPPGTRKVGSPGYAFGCEVEVVDQQLKPVPVDTEGELLVRGSNVMKGYLHNPEATNEALTEKGWLRTGDLGKKDRDGYFSITGRLKELIIKGGENIAPREIDEALYLHPSVIEAAAFARACSDYGQRVEAAVSLDKAGSVSEADLLSLCRTHLGTFKMPDKIHFMDELPKGPSGKIQRRKLSELLV